MPFIERRTDPSQIGQPQLKGVQMPGGVAPVMHESPDLSLGKAGTFWTNLVTGIAQVGSAAIEKDRSEKYLMGQADSIEGKAMQTENVFNQVAYNQGYNKITMSAQLSKLQLDAQQMAKEYAAQGKDVATFQTDLGTSIAKTVSAASASGMDLRRQDQQAWLESVNNTRMLASQVFLKHEEAHREALNIQSLSKEANASMVQMDAAGSLEPAQKYANMATSMGNFIQRVDTDPTLDDSKREAVKTAYFNAVFNNFKTKEDITWGLTQVTGTEAFKGLSIDSQTSLIKVAQGLYEKNAQQEVGGILNTAFEIDHVQSIQELEAKFPRNTVYQLYNEAAKDKRITQYQRFDFLGQYEKKIADLNKGVKNEALWQTGSLLEVAANTGKSIDTIKTASNARYASMGYAKGGAMQIVDGIRLQDYDRIDNGADMLNTAVKGITLLDPKEIQYKDGQPVVRADLNDAITALQSVWANLQGNRREFIFRNLPESIKYGLRQNVDQRQLLNVILDKQRDINNHVKEKPVEAVPESMQFSVDELDRGWTDWGLSEKATIRKAFGPLNLYTSKDDEKLIRIVAQPLNKELQYRYNQANITGRTLSTTQDTVQDLKMKMAANAVQVDDGSDTGAMILLPDMDNTTKGKMLGTTSNDTLKQALSPMFKQIRAKNPQVSMFAMDMDDTDGTFKVRAYTDTGQELTGIVPNIRPEQIQQEVDDFTTSLKSQSQAWSERVPLFIPGVGVLTGYSTKNDFGLPSEQMYDITQWIVHHEGYTPEKGFSILESQNGTKYAKTYNEGPAQAANKLSMYINDKVLPQVMPRMEQYKSLPKVLRDNLLVTEAESTYHAGNAEAFDKYVQRVYHGESYDSVLKDFMTPSKDELFIKGAGDERNAYRIRVLRDIADFVQERNKR